MPQPSTPVASAPTHAALEDTAQADAPTRIPPRVATIVRADDGHPLTLWSRAPPEPRGAIILVHGRTWSAVPDFDLQTPNGDRSTMAALAQRGFAVYALDLRGYGATARDGSGWNTPLRAAADLGAAIDHVRSLHPTLALPAVLGWSLGSLVAQLQAQREASSISALVLYGYPRDPDAPGRGNSGGPATRTPDAAPNTAAAAASDFITPEAIESATIDAFVQQAIASDPVRADWRAMDEFAALDPAAVQTPTLVIHGVRDPFAPVDTQARLFSRLGDADRAWVVLPGCDHAAHLETCAPAFVHAVVAFLDRPPAAGR